MSGVIALHAAVLSEIALLVDQRWAKERAAAIWGMLSAVEAAVDLRDQRDGALLSGTVSTVTCTP